MIFIYKFSLSGCLLWCLFVCLYPIKIKTAEPIRPEFCVGPSMAPGKVFGQLDFKYVILKDKMLTDKAFLKVEKDDDREAP